MILLSIDTRVKILAPGKAADGMLATVRQIRGEVNSLSNPLRYLVQLDGWAEGEGGKMFDALWLSPEKVERLAS